MTYAFPARLLESFVPPGLALDSNQGLGFLALALVEARALRPAFLPRWAGVDFVLAGYRIFVRQRGCSRRGLRILESGANSWRMVVLGNLLTRYNYRKIEASFCQAGHRLGVEVRSADGRADLLVDADLRDPEALPPGSPFQDARQARRFAGPMPNTFSHEPESGNLLRIRGRRSQWRPRLVRVRVNQASFLERSPFNQSRPVLASAFHVRGIDYRWEKAVIEPIGEDSQ